MLYSHLLREGIGTARKLANEENRDPNKIQNNGGDNCQIKVMIGFTNICAKEKMKYSAGGKSSVGAGKHRFQLKDGQKKGLTALFQRKCCFKHPHARGALENY